MITKQATKKITRFDAKLPVAQKELFERAASIGGYRSMTEFIFQSATEKAKKLIDEEHSLFAFERDRVLFFKTLMNPPKPNKALKEAGKAHKRLLMSK